MAVRKKKPETTLGAPLWMITYGDMMTLLLCFFILLFSFSTLDVVKFKDVIIELQGALGVLSGGPMVLNLGDIPAKQMTHNPAASTRRLEQIKENIEDEIKSEGLEGAIETSINERGLLIRFTDAVLFDPGKAQLKPEAIPVLDVVNQEIANINNRVAVEGHTDSTPIRTAQFPSNWELSTARATAIIHHAIENGGIAPERLTAAGYAFYHPVLPNTTAENRAMNRRVDIIILKSEELREAERRVDALNYLESGFSDGIIIEAPEIMEESMDESPEDNSTENDTEDIDVNNEEMETEYEPSEGVSSDG